MTRERNDPSKRVRIAVIFGGQSEEHDVSLRSAQTVMNALDPERYEIVPVGITREGRWITGNDPMKQLASVSPLFALECESESTTPTGLDIVLEQPASVISAEASFDVDVIFPCLHGPMGEDGTVQGMLEVFGKAYVGSGVLGSSLAMDKAMTKIVLERAGIPQGAWMLVQRGEWRRNPDHISESIISSIGFPCFTKPANMGSSVGVKKVHNARELAGAMDEAARLDRRIVVEKGLDVRELEISVLGNEQPIASCVGEVKPVNEFYDYDAKYVDDRSELAVPADLPQETTEEIQRLAVAAFIALDLAGLARVDFFLEKNTGEIFLNEVNTLPGFTSISMFPRLWEASGISNRDLVDRLIELALDRFED